MRRALLAAALALLAAPSRALDVPFLSGRVVDEAKLFDAASAQSLEATLKAYEAKSGHQIVVLTLPSLEGEPLEEFSHKAARTWGIGRKGQNDGILVLVARDDRKMRIEVGYGLEGPLPDALCGRIIRDEMTPRFRNGDYPGGIAAGVNAVMGTLDGTYAAPPEAVRPWRTSSRSGGRNDFAAMNILEKIMVSCFVFGILGLFEFVGIVAPGVGWFLYFFLIPFWAAFPMAIWGAQVGMGLLAAHILGFPILKKLLPATDWGKAMAKNVHTSGNHVYIGGSGWSSGGGSSGWSSGGDSGGFSGGGGDFGGGGASGSW